MANEELLRAAGLDVDSALDRVGRVASTFIVSAFSTDGYSARLVAYGPGGTPGSHRKSFVPVPTAFRRRNADAATPPPETFQAVRDLHASYAAKCRSSRHPQAVRVCELFDCFVALYDPWARLNPKLVTSDNFLQHELTDRGSKLPTALREALRELTDYIHMIGADPGVPEAVRSLLFFERLHDVS
jgi:hypothetical protein